MNNLPENELFSAYLDGELTAAEQADMERLLATSPAARQLLDELRALSSTLQAMPQYELGEDLSQRVLRMAERQVLTDSDQRSKPAPVATAEPRRPLLRRLLNSRGLAWSGVAVAAAVVVMVINADQPQNRHDGDQVADRSKAAERDLPAATVQAARQPAGDVAADMPLQRPSDSAPELLSEPVTIAADGSAAAPPPTVVGKTDDRVSLYAKGIQKTPAPHAVITDLKAVAGPAAVDEIDVAQRDNRGKSKDGFGLARGRSEPRNPAVQYDVAKGGVREVEETAAGKMPDKIPDNKLGVGPGITNGTLGGADAIDISGGMGGGGMAGGGMGGGTTRTFEPARNTAVESEQAETLSDRYSRLTSTGKGGGGHGLASLADDFRGYFAKQIGTAAGEIIVVRLDVSPRAVEQRLLAKVLQNNGIVREDFRAGYGYRNTTMSKRAEADLSLGEQQKPDLFWQRLQDDGEGEIEATLEQLAFAVSATPDQLIATLKDLNGQTSEFLSVRVDPPPNIVQQQELSRYNRGIMEQNYEQLRDSQPADSVLVEDGQQQERQKPDVAQIAGSTTAATRPVQPTEDSPLPSKGMAQSGELRTDPPVDSPQRPTQSKASVPEPALPPIPATEPAEDTPTPEIAAEEPGEPAANHLGRQAGQKAKAAPLDVEHDERHQSEEERQNVLRKTASADPLGSRSVAKAEPSAPQTPMPARPAVDNRPVDEQLQPSIADGQVGQVVQSNARQRAVEALSSDSDAAGEPGTAKQPGFASEAPRAKYRVLFVLRVVGGNLPVSGTSAPITEAADTTQPAQSQSAPADAPQQ